MADATTQEERTSWLARWSYAHRGRHGAGIPENSRAAFDAAIAAGLGIECDVQHSADGIAMVFHDWELDRLTDWAGPLSAHSADRLSSIRLAGSNSTIPTLRSTLAQVKGQVPLLIEVKSRRDRPIEPFCAAIARDLTGYQGLYAVMSFDPRVSRWFARHAPHVLRGLVVTEKTRPWPVRKLALKLSFRLSRAEFLAYDIRDLPSSFARRKRARHIPILSWTISTPKRAEKARLYADAPIAEGAGLA